MPYSIIREKIADYPVDERIMIADAALASLNEMDSEVEAAWGEIALKRLDEIQSGTIECIPASEVLKQAREICRVK